jgi:radical SAM-linked protein
MQRLRVKFTREEGIKFLSHLDLMRFWERAIRRAGFETAYSEGFTPHARLSLAAPLPVGITSRVELMDVWLSGWETPNTFSQKIAEQLPEGMEILETKIVSPEAPSMQSQMNFATYEVEIESARSVAEVDGAVKKLMQSADFPWKHSREKEERHYNLRALVEDVKVNSPGDHLYKIEMRLRCDTSGSGRPEQVALALGFTERPVAIRRTGLIFQ